VPGLLIKRPIKEGQLVANGEIIAEHRSDEYRTRLASLTDQLEGAEVALRTIKGGDRPEQRVRLESDFRAVEACLAGEKARSDRSSELVDTGAIARVEFKCVKAAYRVAKEELKASQQALEIGRVGRSEDIEAREAEVRGLEARCLRRPFSLMTAPSKPRLLASSPSDSSMSVRASTSASPTSASSPLMSLMLQWMCPRP